jgi:histidinol phosphatase-like enzyme
VTGLAVFDLDGTLCADGADAPYPAAPEVVRFLKEHSVESAVATNAGYWVREIGESAAVDRVLKVAAVCGIPSWRVGICPHSSDFGCSCRKPGPDLLAAIFERSGLWSSGRISLWMVGDRWSDIAAGHALGWNTILVGVENYPYVQKGGHPVPADAVAPHFIVGDLPHAGQVIAGVSLLRQRRPTST